MAEGGAAGMSGPSWWIVSKLQPHETTDGRRDVESAPSGVLPTLRYPPCRQSLPRLAGMPGCVGSRRRLVRIPRAPIARVDIVPRLQPTRVRARIEGGGVAPVCRRGPYV